ncbi:YlaF family protein [Aquibacillus koreensis]|uniref:YlaF family protein n=1 Tax=Aquibacillus koreensis TaxID=279446 RepID=A0A9X3WKR3_9BACI|nr:YlaF family protein [Aquibacillus koreensis]MCT2538105.1 YlaF family protein [Aquibacillus koreensis]MDC3420628.1 YlaF family protein [Aquibacillus koreensis]
MKSVQFSKLLLATLVIACFAAVGVAIAYRSFWLAFASFVLGFIVMGYGLAMKRKSAQANGKLHME